MANDGFYTYQLRMLAQANILVSLFIDPQNPDDFVVGFVEAISQRQVMLRSVSPFGRFDGFIVVRLQDIDLVLGEDDYALRLTRLLKLRGEPPSAPVPVEEGENLVHALCRHALREDAVITLWLDDEVEHVGRVLQLDDMRVTIGELDYFGEDPRPLTVALREVEMASTGSEDDRVYQLLADGAPPKESETPPS